MSITRPPDGPIIRFNTQLMAEDAALLGLNKSDWAAKARVSDMSVIRFLRGDAVSPKLIAKLCKALKQKPERYLIRASAEPDQAVAS